MGAVKSLLRYSTAQTKRLEPKRYPQPTDSAPSDTDATKPPEKFLDRLRVVYVESKDGSTVLQENEKALPHEPPSRKDKLPQDRSAKLEDDFHVEKPQQGYLTTKQVMDIFNSRWSNPEQFTVQYVGSKYSIASSDAENLLKYFTNYKMQSPGPSPKPDMAFHPLHR
eukprot:Em0023g754a